MSSLVFNNLTKSTIFSILVEVQNKLKTFYNDPISVLRNVQQVEELRMIEYNAIHSLLTRFRQSNSIVKVPRDINTILEAERSDQKNRININKVNNKFNIFYWDGKESYRIEIDEANFNKLSSRIHKWMS